MRKDGSVRAHNVFFNCKYAKTHKNGKETLKYGKNTYALLFSTHSKPKLKIEAQHFLCIPPFGSTFRNSHDSAFAKINSKGINDSHFRELFGSKLNVI